MPPLPLPVMCCRRQVTAALGEAVAAGPWLSPEQERASHDHYTRHVVYADPEDRYAIDVDCLGQRPAKSDPRTPHLVRRRGLTAAPSSKPITKPPATMRRPAPLRSTVRKRGTLSFDADQTGIHRIANAAPEVAVSIHVYGVGKTRIATDVNRVLG